MFRALFRIFDYSGRSTRWEYWSFFIGMVVVLFAAGIGVGAYQSNHAGELPRLDDDAGAVLAIAVCFLFALPLLALKVRRFHDFGWSGWALLLTLIPLVNIIIELMLLFRGPTLSSYSNASEARQINIYNTGHAETDRPLAQSTHADEITRLADLHYQGHLTADEFAAAKAKVLRR